VGELGPFVRIDTREGKLKLVHGEAKAFTASLRLHLDLGSVDTGWLHFPKTGRPEFLGDDRDTPPKGAGTTDGPRWGVSLEWASPYQARIEDTKVDGFPPHQLNSTASPVLEAIGALWDAIEEDGEDPGTVVAVVEVERWEKVGNFRRPEFALLGYAEALDEPFEADGAQNDTSDEHDDPDAEIDDDEDDEPEAKPPKGSGRRK
jgi:hypothetical protein